MGKAIFRGFSTTHFYFHRTYNFFLRRDHDPEISTAAAAAAVHRACYNQLATTLRRYRAQQQQATPCACDRSALYCVELLWKAREIRHPSHLLVPIISRLLFLACFVRHKTRTQPHTTAAVQRACYNQHPYRAQQQQATPCACDRYALYRHARCTLSSCFVEPEVRHPSHTSNSLLELCSAAEATSCMYARCCPSMHVAAEPEALFQFRQ